MTRPKTAYSKILLILITIIGIFIAFFFLKIKGKQIFPISSIKVASDYHQVSRAHLKQIIAAQIEKENFLTLNIAGLKEQLLTIPWVYDVMIQREWPGTLLIKIEEQKPSALFNDKGVLNHKGDIFYPEPTTVPKNLPQIICHESDLQAVLQYYHQMAILLKPLALRIIRIEYSFDGNLKVVLNEGMKVTLGKTEVIRRWKRFVSAAPRLLQEASAHDTHIDQIDLRYSNGLAVRWSPKWVSHDTLPAHKE